MHAAYEGLPDEMKTRPRGHDRAARLQQVLGDDAAREGQQAPAAHRGAEEGEAAGVAPDLPHHPITRRKVLYANPGYSMRINELPREGKRRRRSKFLFEHQLKPEYRYGFPVAARATC